jgi:hypothetical protein
MKIGFGWVARCTSQWPNMLYPTDQSQRFSKMKKNQTSAPLLTLGLVASLTSLSGLANNEQFDDSVPLRSDKFTLKTSLTNLVQAGSSGEIVFNTQPTVQEFFAAIKLPLPTATLGVADRTAAEDATLTLVLYRPVPGIHPQTTVYREYASCDLDLVGEPNQSAVHAMEYRVNIVSRRGMAPVERQGYCIDSTSASEEPTFVLPMTQRGDKVTVSVDTFARGPFLTGIIN